MTTTIVSAAERRDPVASAPEGPGRRRAWTYFAAGVVVQVLGFAILLLPRATVDKLIEEDGLVEWIGAIGLFVGSGLFLASFLVARRHPGWFSRVGVWSLLVLAIGLFGAGGEEISWGQRLFGWGTPSVIAHANAQDETTLHNLNIFQGGLVDGDRLFRLAYFALFILLPALCAFAPRIGARLRRLLPVAPLWLAGLFLLAWLLELAADHLLGGVFHGTYSLGHSASELQESTVEALTAFVGWHILRSLRSSRARIG